MAEIVVSKPVGGDESELGNGFGFTRCIEYGECSSQAVPPEPFDSERIPVDLGSEIRKFLRVANQIENEEPRIAYLCRFHAFVKAHLMDRNSTGRGVRQFKTSLLQRLERDMRDTIPKRTERSDIRELRRVYKGYEDFIVRYIGVTDYANREKLINARAIASALLEVLNAVSNAAGHRAIADRERIATESELYVPYNILPLDRGGTHLPIMQIPEIKAACAAVQNVRGLPLPEDLTRHSNSLDIFQWLQLRFGFQTGNVANQREHLILLLANTHIRQGQKLVSQLQLSDEAVDGLMRKLFRNYTDWCKFLARKSNIRLPYVKQEAQQYKLLYIGLYLLIWGEAANLRFMPECLCFIYHHMAYELHSMLTSAISLTTSERVMPAYGGAPESFLNNVVCPIYKVIYEEAEKNKNGPAEHSSWRNYDDLNEFFWKHDCFQIGWPMRLDHDFFHVRSSDDCDARKPMFPWKNIREKRRLNRDEELPETKEDVTPNNWLGKTNFVEIRSFWQIFRSFDRMWSFLILALQALIIIGCHELSSPLELTETAVVEDVMSIFITSAILKLIHDADIPFSAKEDDAILDIAFSWKARHTMNFHQILKYVLKLIVAVIWTAILPIYYAQGRRKYTHVSGSRLQEWCSSSYMVAVLFYIMTNAVDVVLFLVPAIGMYIETSNCTILTILSWWTQPRLYVGRGMQEDLVSAFKYTMFWSILLLMKLSFSYYFEIKPLIAPTKQIMRIGFRKYEWHNFFPGDKSNACAVVAVWAPIVLVYFMDTQIWYSVLCAIFGGVYGILNHLGEIRTLRMLRSRFPSLSSAFNSCLIPPSSRDSGGMHLFRLPFKKVVDPRSKDKRSVRYDRDREWSYLFHHPFQKIPRIKNNGFVKFAIVWNKIISSFREEDLLSNREMDLMLISPSPKCFPDRVRWPVFLLADKLSTAVSIARDFVGKDEDLFDRIMNDFHMNYAVKECYESLMCILDSLVVGAIEKRIISGILGEIEEYMDASALLRHIKLSELPTLRAKCTDLLVLLAEGNEHHHAKVVKVLQDIFELVATDMLITGSRTLESLYSSLPSEENGAYFLGDIQSQLFASKDSLKFPLADNGPLLDQVKRFLLLLTVNDTALDIPVNLEARRRIAFFATSLFMNMPSAPKVCNMVSFSVLTPHYTEDIRYSLKELQSSQGQVPIIFYMQKIYPDEWQNFLERMCIENIDALKSENRESVLRDWTSFRGQTLGRTVRGMMYYRKALKLQAFLDMMDDEDILQGYDPTGRGNDPLSAQLDALADLKFTYIISCQMYGAQKCLGDPHAQDILDLMDRYPSLRVAYVEEKELIVAEKVQKVYSSVLVKAVNHFDQEIYRVKLPGQPNIGEGKPENQNHAIIFTRGEALQTIDMNQDNYFEEAFKVRNVLQEFLQHRGKRHPTILGMREHIFTGSISSLAWFMSYQETSLVTIGQRLLANPLRVRFHYGHPDFFDRVFHITRGGISKASKTINLSEDVFAGFNSVLRRGYITYHEYMQGGKGRDVGLNQISKFEAKVANGNSEQSISRDVYRLGHQFDFFRMLSLYFTTIGFYFSSLVSVIAVYVFLYGQLFLILSGLQKTLQIEARVHSIKSLETALASQSYIQLGLLTGLPMVMEIGLEKGLLTAIQDIVLMQLQLASVFFTFSFGTKAHYYGRTILHGGAKYRPTGRKVVIFHASFTENYRLYSRSHFVKGFELMLLLTVYEIFRRYQGAMAYTVVSYAIWFMSFSWLFAPFLFNPSCFNWQTIVDDWMDWNKWIRHQGGIGIQLDKSWQSWWDDEQQHLRQAGLLPRIIEILLSLRFFLYQYGLVYHLNISQQSKNVVVYVLSWVVIVIIFLLVKTVDLGRQWLSANHQLAFRLFKAIIFLTVLSTLISLSIVCDLSFMDLVMCCLAFLPTGWGLILFAQGIRPKIEDTGLWDFMQVLARAYDYGMGIILFFPIAFLAWLPIISAFQSRFLFNQAFNRKLQIRAILAGKKQT